MSKRTPLAVAGATALLLAAGGLAPALAATGSPISWGKCAGAAEEDPVRCGQVTVPIDWAHPKTSATTDIRVARLPATRPADRIGTLFFNPGGPGEGEVGYLVSPQARQYYFPAAIRDRFDIVAVEPRGTGTNPPLNCPLPVDHKVTKFPRNQAEVADLIASNARLGAQCVTAAGPISSSLDTGSVARDADRVREALGETKVSFLGVSYGTMLAQSYAELFPGRVRAMVLDGVVDRSRPWQRLAADGARAVERGFGRFAGWCAANGKCGPDIRATVATLLDNADTGKIRDGSRTVRAEEIAGAVNTGLNGPELYEPLAAALQQTLKSGQLGNLGQLTVAKNPNYPLYRAIICQDVPVPAAEASQLPAEARKLRALAPTLRGYSEFWDIASGCAGWPAPTHWKPHPWRVPASFPPALLASGAYDVATPRPWAEAVRRHLPGSTLIRWDADGHAAWPTHSPSTVAAATTYLLTH